MKVAILGAGAAGLLSAQALTGLRIEHDIFDKEVPTISKTKGLHYLHDNCGLPLNWITVHNYVLGVKEGEMPHLQYSRKLGIPKNNSLIDLPAFNAGYDFRQAINILVAKHAGNVTVMNVTQEVVPILLEKYDYIINTVPLHVIFPQADCKMLKRKVMKGRPEGIDKLIGLNPNQVIYNIDEQVNWYRYSNVLGNEWTEVVEGGEFSIPKIIDTDFHSPDERIILQGRYGKWDRKFLAHHAYYETLRRFSTDG